MKMEEKSGGDGDGGKVVGQEGQTGNGIRQCNDHPSMVNHGGICAFCLQEKLAKLVSSSLPFTLRYSSPSSSSHSFQSGYGRAALLSSSLTLPIRSTASRTVNGGRASSTVYRCDEYVYLGRIWISSLMAKKKNKAADLVLKRSKSTNTFTTPKRNQYLDSINGGGEFSRRNRGGFCSFLFLSFYNSQASKKTDKSFTENSRVVLMADPTPTAFSVGKTGRIIETDEPLDSFIDRKVSRSRSVGCGIRANFDWIRGLHSQASRVESKRESKRNVSQGRVQCSGLFGGFMVSSSSSRSSDWVSSDHSKSTPSKDLKKGDNKRTFG